MFAFKLTKVNSVILIFIAIFFDFIIFVFMTQSYIWCSWKHNNLINIYIYIKYLETQLFTFRTYFISVVFLRTWVRKGILLTKTKNSTYLVISPTHKRWRSSDYRAFSTSIIRMEKLKIAVIGKRKITLVIESYTELFRP